MLLVARQRSSCRGTSRRLSVKRPSRPSSSAAAASGWLKPADGQRNENQDNRQHDDHRDQVGERGSANAAQVDDRDRGREERTPEGVRDLRDEARQGKGSVNRTDQRNEQIVEQHRPSGEEAQMGVEPATHIRIGRAGGGIERRHAPIAHGRQRHRHHGGEQRRHREPAREGLHQCSPPTAPKSHASCATPGHSEHRYGQGSSHPAATLRVMLRQAEQSPGDRTFLGDEFPDLRLQW